MTGITLAVISLPHCLLGFSTSLAVKSAECMFGVVFVCPCFDAGGAAKIARACLKFKIPLYMLNENWKSYIRRYHLRSLWEKKSLHVETWEENCTASNAHVGI